MQGEIRTYFEAEAKELIDRLTRGVASLTPEAGADAQAAAMADMLRAAHTLKGAAHVVGERTMATLAHDFEDGVAGYRAAPSEAGARALLGLADSLAGELAGSSKASEAPVPVSAAPVPAPVADAGLPAARRLQTVRVDVRDARKLLDGLAETGVRVGTIASTLERLNALEGVGTPEMRRVQRASLRREMGDDLDRLGREMIEMHRLASQLRLSTAEVLLLDAGRSVRATAAAQGKQVLCVTAGEAERVEIAILDAMGDALLHLVRNAVAHGIEPAAERKRAGKPAAATIRIEVRREGSDAVLLCTDDGRGIALEPIRNAAVERGELSEAEARSASTDTLLGLLLRPGFSLSQSVDEVSGRGVGLDAVRDAAARVRGKVAIASTVGRGTTFRITAPQTMFAVRAVEVMADGRRFEIPLAPVEQTFRLDPHLREQAGRTQTLLVGRETMAFAWLNEAFPGGAGQANHRASATCLVLAAGSRRMAVGVDSVVGLSDVLVEPLPRFAGVPEYVAGTSMGPAGEPRIVVDPPALLDFFLDRERGSSIPSPGEAHFVNEGTRLPILVIDDSLTTRMLEQSILEAEGYEVELATSAEQGLAMARSKPYALFLVDVEMPGMNGFEFVATARADSVLQDTPAILVTSLDSAESRERGRAAGAFSYIVKGEFNQQIYLDRIRAVVDLSGTASSRTAGGGA